MTVTRPLVQIPLRSKRRCFTFAKHLGYDDSERRGWLLTVVSSAVHAQARGKTIPKRPTQGAKPLPNDLERADPN